jgi:ParB-like chromosome segregation protein Spo0J
MPAPQEDERGAGNAEDEGNRGDQGHEGHAPDVEKERGISKEESARPVERREFASSVDASPVLKSVPLPLIAMMRNPRSERVARVARHASTTPELPHTRKGASGERSPAEVANPDPDLEGLARSLGSPNEPRLAEPPVVEEMPDGRYRLCAGERRVEAARLAGWSHILCLVYPPMDPVRAHTLSLVENMHRAPMHPLEEISALCISRLLANADARGMGDAARALLEEAWERASSGYETLRGLERMLLASGWVPERPDVSWKAHLDDLGISMAPWERKRKLRLLNIEPALQERLRELDITEAALRSLGTLEPGDQQKVVEALTANPGLARKVRRIARARRDGFYDTIEDALAEVQGGQGLQGLPTLNPTPTSPVGVSDFEFAHRSEDHMHSFSAESTAVGGYPVAASDEPAELTEPTSRKQGRSGDPGEQAAAEATGESDEPRIPAEVQDAVLQLLECADRLSAAMRSLEPYRGVGSVRGEVGQLGEIGKSAEAGMGSRFGVDWEAALPEPWGTWSRDALQYIESLLTGRKGDGAPGGQEDHTGARPL